MRRAHALLPGAAALLLASGCASVPRDAGVGEVSQTVAARTGHTLAWQPGQPIEPPADAALDAALEGDLTVDDAVRIALADNRDLLATLEELGIARADLIAARTIRNPLFEGEYHFPGQRFSPYEVASRRRSSTSSSCRAAERSARPRLTAARLRVTASVIGFASEVRAHFYTLQAAQAALAQQQAVTAAAEAAAELAQRQHEAGNVSDLDLENEQARYEEAKLDLAPRRARRAAGARAAARRPRRHALAAAAVGRRRRRLPPRPRRPSSSSRRRRSRGSTCSSRAREVEAARRAGPVARTAPIDDLAAGVHFEREAGGRAARGARSAACRSRSSTAASRRAPGPRPAAPGRAAAARAHRQRPRRGARGPRAPRRGAGAGGLPRRRRAAAAAAHPPPHPARVQRHAARRLPTCCARARSSPTPSASACSAVRDYWLARTDLEAAAQRRRRLRRARRAAELREGERMSTDDTDHAVATQRPRLRPRLAGGRRPPACSPAARRAPRGCGADARERRGGPAARTAASSRPTAPRSPGAGRTAARPSTSSPSRWCASSRPA